MRKIVLLVFVLALLSIVVVVTFIRPIKKVPVTADEAVYIRADGSVEGTDKIQRDENIYTFTDNIVNQSITVERDNIVVDGAGYTLQGTGAFDSKGIDLSGRRNVTIKNIEIEVFYAGIRLSSSSNNSIFGNTVTNNVYGIRLSSSSNNSIFGNNAINNSWSGIEVDFSSDNTFSGNNIANNEYGIYFWEAPRNKFYHNNFINNIFQFMDAPYDHLHWDTELDWIHIAPSINVWNDSYPSGGNYWSDFEERYPDSEDVYSGPNQNETGSDGIWDRPYIHQDNRDNYPLMDPWTPEEEKPTFWMQWWFWTIVIAVIASLAVAVYFLKKKKPPTPTAPTPSTEGTIQNTHRSHSCHSHKRRLKNPAFSLH